VCGEGHAGHAPQQVAPKWLPHGCNKVGIGGNYFIGHIRRCTGQVELSMSSSRRRAPSSRTEVPAGQGKSPL
jgi:hypothetical protein